LNTAPLSSRPRPKAESRDPVVTDIKVSCTAVHITSSSDYWVLAFAGTTVERFGQLRSLSVGHPGPRCRSPRKRDRGGDDREVSVWTIRIQTARQRFERPGLSLSPPDRTQPRDCVRPRARAGRV